MVESISLGNVLTIIALIVSLFIFYFKIANKITAQASAAEIRMETHIATADERMKAFETRIGELLTACANCYLKAKYEKLTTDVVDIKNKQDKRIVELPLQLQAIQKELTDIRISVKQLVDDNKWNGVDDRRKQGQ